MRDPDRIRRLAEKLIALWQTMPDMRLGQMVHHLTPDGQDTFYVEDSLVEKRLDLLLRMERERKRGR
jgi:hypothetical protein